MMIFRKDKFGISLKIIISTLQIRVLWGRKPGPKGKLKGDNSEPILVILMTAGI